MAVASQTDPHAGGEVLHTGVPLANARAAVILIHGRGAAPEHIMGMTRVLPTDGVAYLAPRAAGQTWYPQRFLAPLQENEPWLSSSLRVIERLLGEAAAAGVPRERVLLGGFSQGACLSLEAVLRLGGKYGGVFALSGGIIGPPDVPRTQDRPLDGTPVFVACGDADSHIPLERVRESTRVLKAQGANVTERIYRGLGHTVVTDETEFAHDMIERVARNE